MKIIADIGSNWNTLDDCLSAIENARISGIDIVKFQFFTFQKLYGCAGEMEGELPESWIHILSNKAHDIGLEFMCSVFDYADVSYLDNYVDYHKIASSEANDINICTKCLDTDKKVLFSTGAIPTDIAIHNCKKSNGRMIPMACISEYPARHYPISTLKCFLENEIEIYGMSDHNNSDINIGMEIAEKMGCSFFEFHYNPFGIKSKDAGHSVEVFRRLNPLAYPLEYDTSKARKPKWYRT